MAGWVFEYFDGDIEDWVEFTGRIGEITEELNGHEEATIFIPNSSANRTFVQSDQIVKITYNSVQMFVGALFAVEYSNKELKCIVYNGVYELMKRRVISEIYESEPANNIMEDVRVAAGLYETLGSCPTTALDMNFDQTLCYDAMVEVAKACSCDYWVQDGDTLYLGSRGSAQSFDSSKAKVSKRGVDRGKIRDKVHVRGFSAEGEELLGVAGTGDNVAVFWNNFATTQDTLDLLAAKLLTGVNIEDSQIRVSCPITEGFHLHPGDTITVSKSALNLDDTYKVMRTIKTRASCIFELNRSIKRTEDILEELSKTRNEVFNFTTFVSQGGGGGSGGEEEPPEEEEFGFITISLEDGYLQSREQMLVSDALLFDPIELIRSEDQVFCNSVPQATLLEERRQLEFSMVESFYVNHGGTKQVGETIVYTETHARAMDGNPAEGESPDFEEELTITNE
ncbi:MAG: hypothetical protein IAX21_04125 [Candidatus Bathyarchaeota archaeon]|nr:MAG: hypothetical protein IAX21_04125 [Candidatus Bathyarchaeota archaeon]